MSDILIVEDEVVLARSIASFMERRGFSASYAVDAASARAMFQRDRPRLAILDYKLNEDDGLALLGWMRDTDQRVQVVMMTGHGDIDVAVRAMKSGARDFLVKPTPLTAIASIATELMLDELQGGLDRTGVDRILGRSSAANGLRATIRKLAATPTGGGRPGVLIMGPKGSGKALAARALHETGAPETAFISVDCALDLDGSDNVLETAVSQAIGGTLLLRNVARLAMSDQAKLLRLIQSTDMAPALVATSDTHLVPGEAFMAELLYRIQVGWIDIPPLSDRAADVLPIADFFARRIARARGEARPRFTSAARAKLLEHDWPGNIAELENCIERAMLEATGGKIDAAGIRPIGAAPHADIRTLKEIEVGAINKALTKTDGNVSRAAEMLGISRDTLRYRMEKFELSRR